MSKHNKDNLLNILVETRTVKALDRAVCKNKAYQNTCKKQMKAFKRLDTANLNKEQHIIVDNAISATTDCGAAYGTIAYKLGLRDGIKLMSEIKKLQ